MPPAPEPGSIPVLRVVVGDSPAERRGFVFQQPFRIGRAQDCEVSIQSEFVSRLHADVTFKSGQWWVVDSGSVNGLFVDNRRVAEAPVAPLLVLRLGVDGPFVWLRAEESPAVPAVPAPPAAEPPDPGRTQALVEKYFGDPVEGESVGEHTSLLRRAYRQVQKKQKRRYGKIIAVLALLTLGIAGFAAYQFQQTRQQRALAAK